MPAPVSRRVLLVSSPDDIAIPWPLASLRDHLRHAGHEVAVSGDLLSLREGALDVDVIHAFGWSAGRVAADTAGQVPWVLTAPWTGSAVALDAAEVARGAALVLCASSASADAANRRGVSHQLCRVMPVGVDVGVFTRHGPSANRTTAQRIMARAIGPGDGVHDLIAALPAIPGVELVILVGTAVDDEVVRHHESLIEGAQAVGVRGRVALVPVRDALERAWLLRSADVAVSVGRQGGDHAFVVEAMACGKAAVVTAIGPQRDLVIDDVTGLHVPAGRVRALALTLRHLLRDPFTMEGMGLAGADRARSRCAWPRVAHEFGSAYVQASGAAAALHGADLELDGADAELDDVDVELDDAEPMRTGT